MVRALAASVLVLGLVAGAGVARASGTGRAMGMYPTIAGAPAAAPLPMLDSKVEITIRGPLVECVVTQKFINRGDHAIEATYIFPLPSDAAVSAMSIKTGTRTIKAAIERREDAQRRYEAAVNAGVSAAVTDQERPDVFTQTVAAIPPKGAVEIVLRYDSLARYADGSWQLALPMVVAPRYVPGTVSGRPTTGTGRSPDTDRAPDASRVTPGTGPQAGGATQVAIHFAEAVSDVTSPPHELADAKGPEQRGAGSPRAPGSTVAFTDPFSDHDAIVRWKAKLASAGWVEAGARGGYAAVIVEAPAAAARKGATRVLLILDRAATMRGDANVVAQPFVRALFAALTPADKVAVIGSDKIPWTTPAEAWKGIEQAWTRPGAPLDLTGVLTAARPEGAAIVLVSDGLIADDANVLAAARKLGVPVHVIGVGPAPARALLTQLAASTGGTVRFVLPADDLGGIAKAAVLDVASPPQPLTVNWGTLAASDVVPGILPRLGAGQAMLVLARVTNAQTANVCARCELFSIETVQPGAALAGATTAAGPLARRWARIRLDELVLGRAGEAAVTQRALEFGLVSPYPSLVAVGTDVVVQGGTKHSVAVPVSVPSGMHWTEVKHETSVDFGGETVDTLKRDKKKVGQTEKANDERDRDYRPSPIGGAARGEDATASDEEDGESPRKNVAVLDSAPMAESISVTGSAAGSLTVGRRSVLGRGFRASLGLGGGLVIQDDTRRALIATSLRFEVGRDRSLFGAEGALWLVDGFHGQGHVLATYARLGLVRYLEVGIGLGLHVGGDGVGPAGSISLRLHLPPAPWASAYLRYDGALLTGDDDVRRGQNTTTLGVEWGF
ncbi:hypothetical protein BH11MYX3_BH11MYX3_22260 [soil metagenome]